MGECSKPIKREDFSLYIPGWALSKETIPIHVEWINPNINKIILKIPNEFEITDVLNAKKHKIVGGDNEIEVIFLELNVPKSAPHFFTGIKVKTKGLITEMCEIFNVKALLFINEKQISEVRAPHG